MLWVTIQAIRESVGLLDGSARHQGNEPSGDLIISMKRSSDNERLSSIGDECNKKATPGEPPGRREEPRTATTRRDDGGQPLYKRSRTHNNSMNMTEEQIHDQMVQGSYIWQAQAVMLSQFDVVSIYPVARQASAAFALDSRHILSLLRLGADFLFTCLTSYTPVSKPHSELVLRSTSLAAHSALESREDLDLDFGLGLLLC